MDSKNRFHTALTYWIMRGEHLAILAVCSSLVLFHWSDVNWWRFWIAFWLIDVIGYIPGAFAFKRNNGNVHPWFHRAYNITHTYLVSGSGAVIWAYFGGGFEWAMLAVPIHLSIDRGVFGNVLKPTDLSFEPQDHSDEVVLEALGRRHGRAPKIVNELPLDAAALNRIVEHPSGYLALSGRNQKFTSDGLKGFISYRKQGRHLWMFGGVHADANDADTLLQRFLEFAASKRLSVGAVQVMESQKDLFASYGFTVNQMGSSYALELKDFSLSGGKKSKLRNKINKATKSGMQVVELGREVPRTRDWFDKLDAISDLWIAGKDKKELDFMVGEIGDETDSDRRIFIVLDTDEQPVAFISYVPVMGTARPGYLHDLTRKVPGAPTGAMDLCNATAIERFRDEGVQYLHFGFTPFITDPQADGAASRILHQFMQWVRKHGQRLYPADSQQAYKLKWGVNVIEREYVAVRRVSLKAAWDLMSLTRSV